MCNACGHLAHGGEAVLALGFLVKCNVGGNVLNLNKTADTFINAYDLHHFLRCVRVFRAADYVLTGSDRGLPRVWQGKLLALAKAG